MTLARQSNSKEVLKNIKRDNIKLDAYSTLQEKFNLINGAKKVFAFQVKGRGVNHIENKVSDFLQKQMR